ncbi:phage protein NinX family protein [Proteus terrae]|uniref:phage protein NinX family protein n=1 Tax=Proteus terrae TaxID=1574161 RepID=UPI001BAC5008|nr:phage protein NinX family protein [Proteus terrae]QUT02789.1 DUF2591 family protein [Proteus terrae subsp. cibarius]
MNKYTELSDFEINKKVAERLFLKFTDNWSVILVDGESFDPCNNPSDAMPIALDNGISLTSPMLSYGEWKASYFRKYYARNINPYRAAMEVFLMMKDAGNNQ